MPGIRRRKAGRGFSYVGPDGRRVVDVETRARIEALAIPPAWTEVWICPWPNGHIQAIGTDARGRRQYRYHDSWRLQRDREKFAHVLEVARALPRIRRACDRDIAREGMPKERALACAVRLLDVGFFRIGGEQYAEENGTYGVATLLKRHARIAGEAVIFDYPAKTGKRRVQAIVDPEVRAVIELLKRRRGGGPELLAYKRGGRWVDLVSSDINEYLHTTSGLDVTAKDFRTWNATVLAAMALAAAAQPSSRHAHKRLVAGAIKQVAEYLGNTPAVCRSSYVDPRVVDRFLSGDSIRGAVQVLAEADMPLPPPDRRAGLEAAVVELLEEETSAVAA